MTTRLSTKGQIILPKSIRESWAWGPGTEFEVEQRPDGIFLRPVPSFPKTRLEDVAGLLKTNRPAVTLEEMDAGIAREIKRRYARGR